MVRGVHTDSWAEVLERFPRVSEEFRINLKEDRLHNFVDTMK